LNINLDSTKFNPKIGSFLFKKNLVFYHYISRQKRLFI
jgi:hypothetical protein